MTACGGATVTPGGEKARSGTWEASGAATGTVRTRPAAPASRGSPGAVETLTRYRAKELGARGIRVNVLAPGAIETDFGSGVVRDNADLNRMITSQTALGRVGLPDDIGAAVSALLSPGAGWIQGQRIEPSGGMFL